MSNGELKTRFKIEGEQEYRSAINNAANAIKVLNSEQKLAKAQFQNTGNAEKYAAQQSEILKKKIEEQKKAVEAAQKAIKQMTDGGVSPASRQFQQWQTKLNNAETALVQMETELRNVNSTMQETTATAEETGDAVGAIGKKVSFDAVIGGIGKITDKMTAAIQTAKSLAAELINTMTDAASWADDLATQATVYGISNEELQRMRYTADLLDTSVESIMKSRQRLINNMVYGNEDVQDTFRELGVATQEFVQGKYGPVATGYRDWADVFWDVGDALMRMEDYEQASAYATKIFGRSWAELLPLFNSDWAEQGYNSAREYYEATKDSWEVVSDENVQKLTTLDDTLQKLEDNFTTLKETILAQLAPAFTQVGDTVSNLLVEFNKYLNSEEGQAKLQDLSDAVTDLFIGLTDVDFGVALETAKSALNSLTSGLEWISKNWSTVVTGLEALGIAFGLLKVSETVLTFMQLLSAGKFLSSADAAAAGAAAGTSWGSAFAAAVLKAAPWMAFLYTLLNPAGTATDANGDSLWDPATGKMTYAGWDDYLGSPENWESTLAEVGEQFGDLARIMYDREAIEAIGKYKFSDEHSLDQLIADLEALGYARKQVEEAGEFTEQSGPIGPGEEYTGTIRRQKGRQTEAAEAVEDGGENVNAAMEVAARTIEDGGVEMSLSIGTLLEAVNRGALELLNPMAAAGKQVEDGGDDINWAMQTATEVIDRSGLWIGAEMDEAAEGIESGAEAVDAAIADLAEALHAPGSGFMDSFFGGSSPFSHANGLWSVPWDGYPAILHKGERVLTAGEANRYTYNNYFGNVNLHNGLEVEALTESIERRNQRQRRGYGS